MTNQVQKIENQEVATVQDMGSAMLSMFERVILDPSVPVERIEKMMEMQERWEARQSEKLYSEALAAAKAEMPTVLKNKKNNQTNSKYADLEAIDKAISPIISKHGFSLSFFPAKSNLEGHYGVTCEVRHEAGHKVIHEADIPADGMGMKGNANKTATHAFGSTMSYGRRYLKTMIFDIATGDDDGNAAGKQDQEPITENQFERLQDLIEKTETDIAKFCQVMKIESLKELPSADLGKAERLLEAKAEKMKGKSND